MKYQYTAKNSFPYKNKMQIKANGAIKSIMNKNVKTNIKFQNKNNEENKFFSTARNCY